MKLIKKINKIQLIKIAATLALIMQFNTTAFAQSDKYSFRLRGLGEGLHGFVDDLYSDLSLNPYYIYRFSGNWLFTNLSNMQGREDVATLDQNSSLQESVKSYPSNLLGTITSKWGSPFGIFFESSGYDQNNFDSFKNLNYTNFTSGSLESGSSTIDTDFLNRSINLYSKVGDYGVAISFHKFGFGINTIDINASGTFSEGDSSGNLINNTFVENTIDKGFDLSNTFIGFGIGRVFKENNIETSISIGRRPEKFEFNDNEMFSLYKEPFFGIVDDELSNFDNNDYRKMELGLKADYISLRRKIIDSSPQTIQITNMIFNFTRYTVPLKVGISSININDSLAVIGTDRKTIKNTISGIKTSEGDIGINRAEIGAGIEKHFDNFNSMIAFGVKANYIWGNLDYKFSPGNKRELNEVVVEVGDPSAESASYNRIFNDNLTETTTASIKGIFLSLPVGFETKLTDKLTFRAGAQTVIPLSFESEWKKTIIDDVDQLVDTDENSTTFSATDGFKNVSTDVQNINGKSLQLNTYHFGASYKFNDKINLDLLHFAKITELDTWWLSVIIKY